MSKKSKKSSVQTQRIIITVFGLMMAAVLLIPMLSSIFPDDATTVSTDTDADVTADVPIVFPPPTTDVNIENVVVNQTGLFQVPLLTSWAIFQQQSGTVAGSTYSDANTYDPGRSRADIILSNPSRYSIVQAYVLLGTQYQTTQELSDNLFTDSYFVTEWSADYESAEITKRTVGTTLITIDFDLIDEKLHYYGRQISWQDQGHVWNLRFVVPSNNPIYMENLQKVYLEHFIIYPHNATTLLTDWQVFADPTLKMFVKVPNTWRRATGGEGRASSYADPNDDSLLVATQNFPDATIASIDEAQSWLTVYRPDAAIFEGQAITRVFAGGYWFSYTFPTADGDTVSAAMALFPNPEGGINVAEVRQAGVATNLLSLEAETPSLARQILETFTIMAPANYIYINQSGGVSGATTTPDPLATTTAPTLEGTAEATTSEATIEATTEPTVEASVEPTLEATVEATVEASVEPTLEATKE